uniref:CBF domain-containing protein n=1 Tax=Ascaris lumbricoides TaxID=6252 RepID=A0A0M3INC7_ASCLU
VDYYHSRRCKIFKEVDKGGRGKEKRRLLGKRIQLAKERQSKSKAKYAKQLKKLEEDLKEVEAAESLSTKLKYVVDVLADCVHRWLTVSNLKATEAMKHIFVTYFRVIKHMPRSALLEPVLEGLSKFAHLLNVEFFDDIISALQSLIEQQHMRVLDSLHCVHAAFVILSGEGVAINVDPFRFYKSVYRLMTNVPFEKRPELRDREISVMLRTLDMMINLRRKQVSLCRVAAFVKRLLIICFILPSHCVVAILAGIRTFFVSHPRLSSMLESGEEVAASGLFKPDVDDPDCCKALSSAVTSELSVLCKHSDPLVVQLAKHLRAGLPSSGAAHISAEISTRKPYEWIERCRKQEINDEPYFYERILLYCKKRKVQLSSKNMQMVLNDWLITML